MRELAVGRVVVVLLVRSSTQRRANDLSDSPGEAAASPGSVSLPRPLSMQRCTNLTKPPRRLFLRDCADRRSDPRLLEGFWPGEGASRHACVKFLEDWRILVRRNRTETEKRPRLQRLIGPRQSAKPANGRFGRLGNGAVIASVGSAAGCRRRSDRVDHCWSVHSSDPARAGGRGRVVWGFGSAGLPGPQRSRLRRSGVALRGGAGRRGGGWVGGG
jgi:hypothetical protein